MNEHICVIVGMLNGLFMIAWAMSLMWFQIWHEAPFDLQRSLYEHFFELLTESR